MCVYCENLPTLIDATFQTKRVKYFAIDEDRHLMIGNDYAVQSAYLEIDFCPMCGRNMKEGAMSGFYRFPAMKGLEEWDNVDQISKLEEEEVDEAKKAYFGSTGELPYGLELMDVIQAAETALRMNFGEDEVEHLRQLTIEKNRKRGYYG